MSRVCLGIPGEIVERSSQDGLPVGTVDFGGLKKQVCLAYAPEAGVGDYIIVHVGFAISVVDRDEAHRTLAVLRSMAGAVEGELGQPLPEPPGGGER